MSHKCASGPHLNDIGVSIALLAFILIHETSSGNILLLRHVLQLKAQYESGSSENTTDTMNLALVHPTPLSSSLV